MFYQHCLKVIFTLNFIYLDFCPFPKVFSIAFAKAQLSITTTFSSCCRCVSSRPWGNEIYNNPYVSILFPHQSFYSSTPALLLSEAQIDQ